MKHLYNVRYYGSDFQFHKGGVYIDKGRLIEVYEEGKGSNRQPLEGRLEEVDGRGCYLIPGLIDTHFHGCLRADFCHGTTEALERIANYEASCGVTTLVPATMSYSEEILQAVSTCYREYQPRGGAEFCGIHMEGPFINVERCGAQNPAYIQRADIEMYRRLQEASGNAYRVMTIAPEIEGAAELIQECHEELSLSFGHSMADYEEAKKGFELGLSRMTHCCNAMHGLNHRSPGPIAAASEQEKVWVELICDGVHLHPAMVRLCFRLFGAERLVLVSDSMEACGLEDGQYELGGQAVTVRGKEARLADGTLAGSVSNLMDCVRVAVQEMGLPLEEVIRCASYNPAKSVGLLEERGSIEVGKWANLVLLNEQLEVQEVYLKGKSFLQVN